MRAMYVETVMGEFEDALDVLDQLHMVMARLKRMALVNDDEHQQARQSIDKIAEILNGKMAE